MENKLHIEFKKVEIPKMVEVPSNKNYYLSGRDNKFFDKLIYYYETSSAHSSFIKNLTNKVGGSGFIGTTDEDNKMINDYKLNPTFFKTCLDYSIFGGFALEIIWNALHTKINKINYIDFSKVRSGFIDEEEDKVNFYYYSPDWFKWKKDITLLQNFNPDPNTENRQILYYKDHSPGTQIYPLPPYYGGLNWIYTDVELSKYYSNLVKNNFVGNTIIAVNAPMDQEKQVAFEEGINKDFTSAENAGSILVIYTDGGEKPIEIMKFNEGADDKKYQWLSQHILDQLIIAHRIPNPIIAGVRVEGSLGGTQEMQDSENIYNVNVVYPTRDRITRSYNEIFKYLPQPLNYQINDNSLFKTQP